MPETFYDSNFETSGQNLALAVSIAPHLLDIGPDRLSDGDGVSQEPPTMTACRLLSIEGNS